MKKSKLVLLGMVIMLCMISAIPVSAQSVTNSNSNVIAPAAYCPSCTMIGLPYPKKDYSRSDFIGATIQYNGYTYRFLEIDDSLSTSTRWWTVWYR
ncbi:hypothetical protein [Paenibacillus sp. Leaf72]|uniref:hypothetical protein n=1 Tax=Paenibacillus sp. Leaf72 TaxID=1736234 RepID=UPI0012DCF592|nr:hypothetical protein [Paenibacillus sp. Leaf72]